MAFINFQPRPKIPPIGFFQPISTDPADMMTDVEFLLGMLKKLNETIKQVNSNTDFIEEYSGKIEEIEADISNLRQELTDFENEITESIATQFAEIKSQISALIRTAVLEANAYTDVQVRRLEQMISEISLGQIQVYDPTTGVLSPLQDVIDNLYGSGRDEALTATEYDNLELTATVYDGKEISAYDYDKYGKTLLMA